MQPAHARRQRAPSGAFTKILLPIDLSDRHRAALDLAAKLVRRQSGEVVLLHVIETIAGLPSDEGTEFYGRLEQAARKKLHTLAGVLNKRKVGCRVAVVYGHRVVELIRYAAEARSDLIIATAPPVDPKNVAAGWGSLSYRVSLLAPCPVLLVK
jgi:nucleotide-binding universal stress UspA family protein